VFAADLQPRELVARATSLRARAEGPAAGGAAAARLAETAAFDAKLWLRGSALAGLPLGPAGDTLRRWARSALSALTPSPANADDPRAWAYKNTMPAAQTFMLACAAHGLCAHPMEGFDPARVAEAVGLPAERYAVPVVVPVGYALEDADADAAATTATTWRFPPQEVCFQDRFGAPLPGVPDLAEDAAAAQQANGGGGNGGCDR